MDLAAPHHAQPPSGFAINLGQGLPTVCLSLTLCFSSGFGIRLENNVSESRLGPRYSPASAWVGTTSGTSLQQVTRA